MSDVFWQVQRGRPGAAHRRRAGSCQRQPPQPAIAVMVAVRKRTPNLIATYSNLHLLNRHRYQLKVLVALMKMLSPVDDWTI